MRRAQPLRTVGAPRRDGEALPLLVCDRPGGTGGSAEALSLEPGAGPSSSAGPERGSPALFLRAPCGGALRCGEAAAEGRADAEAEEMNH